jgi:hypothetical protein
MNTTDRSKEHPVWDVYNEFRTARLNVRYHEFKLRSVERLNMLIEWLLAISASSNVAALWFWKSEIGSIAWKVLGAIVAILAVSMPILKLTEKVRKYAEVLGAYLELEHDFNKLKIKISQERKYDNSLRKELEYLLEKKGNIIKKYKSGHINEKLRDKCQEKVNRELPSDEFYIPKED